MRKFRLGLAACLFLVAAAGCNSSTDPTPDDSDVKFTFSPAVVGLDLTVGQTGDFAVAASAEAAFTAQWTIDGVPVGSGPTYTYLAAAVGRDTLRVAATAGTRQGSYFWIITVSENAGTLPPPVSSVSLSHGQEPTQVRVAWNFVTGSEYPIVEYLVAFSLAGPINVDNWDQATPAAAVPSSGAVGYLVTLDQGDGLVPGQVAWFAVRARDEAEQLSPLPVAYMFTVSYAWELAGRVIDDRGEGIPLVILHFDYQDAQGSSGADGSYAFGPISSADSVSIRTTAVSTDPVYYNFRSETLRAAQGGQYDICLIQKYGADESCNDYQGDFLLYLRGMTGTSPDEPLTRLYKWEGYPVACYIPDYVRAADGADFGGMAREALAFWNQDLGEEYLYEVATPAEADIRFEFSPDLPVGLNGQVVLALPQGGVLGDVVPELMLVQLDADMDAGDVVDTELAIKGVSLHELGHALGLYKHSSCDGYRLMDVGAGAAAFQPGSPYPIHPDEHRAVIAIRHLPQGVNMDRYFDD